MEKTSDKIEGWNKSDHPSPSAKCNFQNESTHTIVLAREFELSVEFNEGYDSIEGLAWYFPSPSTSVLSVIVLNCI